MRTTFQNKVSTSKLTLPAVTVCGFVSYLLYGAIEKHLLPQMGILALSTILFVTMNRSFALLRVYSRTISSSFLLLSLAALPLNDDIHGCIFQLLFIIFYIALFKAYQQKMGPSTVFLAFAILGICSIEFIQILFLVPILWMILGTTLMAGSAKNYMASVIGLLCPYWLWFSWAMSFGDIFVIVDHIKEIASFRSIQIQLLGNRHVWILAFIMLTDIFVSFHYFTTSLEDKIKTRMLYTTFVIVNSVLVVLLILQPQHEENLLRAIIVSISPLLGHSVTFSRSRFSNYIFISFIALAFSMIGYNIWMAL